MSYSVLFGHGRNVPTKQGDDGEREIGAGADQARHPAPTNREQVAALTC
jgi:hypothetical protein